MLLQVITAYRTELSKSPRCVVALLRSSITYGDLHIMEQLLILLPESLATYYSACSSGMPLLTQAVLLDSPISIIQLLLSVSVIACAIDTPVSSDVARGAGVSTTAMLPSARDNNCNFNVVLNDGDTALHAAVRKECVPVVRLLLLNGADVHRRVMDLLITARLRFSNALTSSLTTMARTACEILLR